MKHEIDVVISDGGKIEATVNGVEGPVCKDLTKWFQKLGKMVDKGATKDMYKKEKVRIGEKVEL